LKLSTLSLAILGMVALGAGAQAQSLYGTFGFVPLGTLTANNAALNAATSVVVPSTEIANTSGATYLGHANVFSGIESATTLISLSTTTISNGGSLGISWTFGGVSYTFTPTTTVALVGSTSPSGNYLTFAENGMLSDGGSFTPQLAQLAGSFSQTSNGGAVNANFTFSTPPQAPATPEPGTVAMVAGMGIAGAGFLARRRK